MGSLIIGDCDAVDEENGYRYYTPGLGLASLIVINLAARSLASLFTQDPEVMGYAMIYLRWILIGFIGMNLYNWNGQAMNAIGKTMWTLGINAGGAVFVMMPALYLGAKLSFGWMMAGLAMEQILVGVFAIGIGRRQFKVPVQLDHQWNQQIEGA